MAKRLGWVQWADCGQGCAAKGVRARYYIGTEGQTARRAVRSMQEVSVEARVLGLFFVTEIS